MREQTDLYYSFIDLFTRRMLHPALGSKCPCNSVLHDKLAQQTLVCARKQRPVSTADQGFSAFAFNYYFLTQRI